MKKSGWIGIRVDEVTRARVEELAAADGRSISSWVAMLIQREIDRTPQTSPRKSRPAPKSR